MRDEKYPGIPRGLTTRQEVVKRLFDLCVAIPAFIVTFPAMVLASFAATIDTGEWGIFSQVRVGRAGEVFRVHKIRSMKTSNRHTTTVTVRNDPRITRYGALMRRTKIDELPQLWNVIVGEMSLIGPRPDMVGWADELKGDDRVVLSIRPGITGPASIAFRDEEIVLSSVEDPAEYNSNIIWPEKVRLNIEYIKKWSLAEDIVLLMETAGLKV